MKAIVNGVELEGSPEEIAKIIQILEIRDTVTPGPMINIPFVWTSPTSIPPYEIRCGSTDGATVGV